MKKVIQTTIAYIGYVLLLVFCYQKYIIKAYGYYGFYSNPNSTSIIFTTVMLLISLIYLLIEKTDKYSKLVIYILFIINYIPSLLLHCFMPEDYGYIILHTVYWLIAISAVNIISKITIRSTPKNKKQHKIPINRLYVIICIELAVVFLVMARTGIHTNVDSVYDLRENYTLSKVPILISYLFAATKVVNPVIYLYISKSEKRIWPLVAILIQIAAFLCDGSKSTLLSLAIVIIINILMTKRNYNYLKDTNFKNKIISAIATVNLLGLTEYITTKTTIIYNYFIRRLFFLPALLHMKYYDFFSKNEFDYYRQSIMGKIGLESDYVTPIQNIIGKTYFDMPNMFANNGLFSDAFANLGVIGVIIMPILLVLALRLLDYSSNNIKPIYITTILISVSYIFMSSSFFTVLLTHGFILLCIILKYMMPKDSDEKA